MRSTLEISKSKFQTGVHKGKGVVDTETNIRNEYKNEFTHRLRTREMDDQLKVHENMQNQLCKLRLIKVELGQVQNSLWN